MSTKTKMALAAGVVAITGAGLGVAAVGASAGDDQEPTITGTALEQASDIALAETGGGRVTDTEVGDEESYYEVEVTLDDGTILAAQQMLGGGPSVLYDAVAILVSTDGATVLAAHPAAKDFVTDAHAHCKIIGHIDAAQPLLDATGLTALIDAGYVQVANRKGANAFLDVCRAGRYWARGEKP